MGSADQPSTVRTPALGDAVRVFFAPGRVNLIGEHTDYNGGHVLPAALNIGTWLFVRPRQDKVLRFASASFEQVVEVPAANLTYKTGDDYANYPKGVIHEFEKRGFEIPGLDLFYYGNLPNGAGLSSSASMEVVTASMMNELLGAGLSREELALLSQAAENQFVGVNCGIMDQFAVALGKQHHAISLNCDTLAYQLVPVRIEGVSLVIANTNKRRGLTDSKYNERRGECEAALVELQKVRPGIGSLGDIDEAEWTSLEGQLADPVLQKRARHVVLENNRAKRATTVLRDGDIAEFGRMMNASHESLRDDYEVTGKELDSLVEAAWAVGGCIGSRMTGAGFGGCTVSLVEADKVDEFVRAVGEAYTARIGYAPSFYVTDIGDGVKEVTNEVLR
ncbi:galactokinase [Alicyclobacillus ferrooxydans]|uniref:Galactokinase n=1 Tax=Alicyclobacillus ferrooxydans TaxID=471514 RepID=A0A0P9CX48_9BACL|nr:galactokinase [Alicyclobacillus ferrooxydans]KPV44339.1 galactokinase [Alicyclobacillus ferrooxydans]